MNLKELMGDAYKEGITAEEISNFFEKYERVFSGEVAQELKSLYVQRFNTASLLQSADEEVLGTIPPKFMMDM